MRPFGSLAPVLALILAACAGPQPSSAAGDAPFDALFTTLGDIPLGAPTSRFDYQSFDPTSGRLAIAKMGSGKLLVFDTKTRRLVAELENFPKVTGVLIVPELHKIYASVPGAGIASSISLALGIAGMTPGSGGVAIVDSTTMKETARLSAGLFPDGIAYDPDDQKIFVSDEMGGGIDVIDARTDRLLARVDAGGEVGNVQYDPMTRHIYAPVQSRNELAVVDPKENRLLGRYALAGCKHPHGLRIADGAAIGYVACDRNDRLLVVDLTKSRVIGDAAPLGHDPDVLAADPSLKRLYVASESGVLSVFDVAVAAAPKKLGDAMVGDHAHSVAVDPITHRLFLPLRDQNGEAVLRIIEPKLQH